MEKQIQKKKIINYILFGLLIVLLGVGGVFGYKKYQVYKAEKQVEEINRIVGEDKVSRDNCKVILDFDKILVSINNKFFKEKKYDIFREKCNENYNISRVELKQEFCENIIKGNQKDFEDKYIILDTFEDIRNKCIEKFLTIKFSTGSLFDVENDFKTSIFLDFSSAFFEDKGDLNSDEFLNNRIEAKKRLANLIEVSNEIKLDYKDIILYPKRATIFLDLEPLTEYKISLKSFDSGIEGEKIKKQEFSIKTPENKYFGFKILDRVSLYKDTMPPRFELIEYNSSKKKTKFKICRIHNEEYAKIEVFRETTGLIDEKKEFFKTGIDKLKTLDCKEKEIVFKDENTNDDSKTSLEGQKSNSESKNNKKIKLIKKEFNFDDIIGKPSRSGLYYVTFLNPEDREYNNRIQAPIFFGIIDSHITMKISRNGEAFFFVNDFEGKPLEKQKIRVYINDFIGKETKRNNVENIYKSEYFSPLKKDIFSKQIVLGETGKDGILKVNLKGKIDNIFNKTFEGWDYNRNGNYNSLFITSASDNNLTYVSSKWNGGISPWNFGYTVGNNWWYGPRSENSDEITLNQWGRIEPELYTHIYTDRKLYLPGEKVNIKAVIRKSKDLSIPEGKEINLKIKNSKGKEISNKNLKINDFGSINDTLELKETYPLGNYSIVLTYGDKRVGFSGFSVEIFKNPKFKNEVMLKTSGLNGELVKINKIEKDNKYYRQTKYKGKFKITASILSKYYSGNPVKNATYKYKVYKQYYYENSYRNDCYYGCYWEPKKEFYTEGKGTLNSNGQAIFDIDIDFESSYSDYKYIVEVSVVDTAGDNISGSNSIIAKLPSEFKKWDPNSGIQFKTENRFSETGKEIIINGGLTSGKWGSDYGDKFLIIIKRKEYETKIVDDVRGYKRPITRVVEKLEKVLKINSKNFEVTKDGKLKLKYKLKETSEYVFEFGKIDLENLKFKNFDSNNLIDEFNKTKKLEIIKDIEKNIKLNYNNINYLVSNCVGEKENDCDRVEIYKSLGCKTGRITNDCRGKEKTIKIKQKFKLDNLISKNSRKFFTVLSYGGDREGKNPILSDNKIRVLSEKISYNLGDKALILIRLPFSEGKILWTVEKQGVLKQEYIDVKTNIFFKEIIVDDTFIPNAYIGVVAIDTRKNIVPEYKVGYTEIVVDKTDKKTFLEIKTNKKEYSPREEVILDIKVSDKNKKGKKSELTVMVVDDSLISLMGNVDLNTLEKIYKKLPFQIQTAITNIAMLKNYYFSRPGIVGGSGFGNFKGGDSAVSSRNIFKNTAYYNSKIITDNTGKARVKFNLPDNLTNFRIMVISNSKDNFFGYSEKFIEVRKDIIIEDKTPLILREGDKLSIGANIFNTTSKEIGFKLKLEATGLKIKNSEKNTMIKGGSSEFIYFDVETENTTDLDRIDYKITVLGDTPEHSDKIEGKIKIKETPVLISNIIKTHILEKEGVFDTTIELPENTDIEKSKLEIVFSNNILNGVEKIVNSLAIYPYGCIEQTMSSTYPNAIILKFEKLFKGLIKDKQKIKNNITAGIKRVESMQTESGGFTYWPGDTSPNLDITPFVLRRLLDMREYGADIPKDITDNAAKYLENNFKNITNDLDKAETFLSFTKLGKGDLAYNKLIKGINTNKLSRHTLIAYTYGLVLFNKEKFKTEIEANISKIKLKLDLEEKEYRYWNKISDKAIFVSMLIDYNYDFKYIYKLISDLYSKDWSSYYYSTQAKNNSFIAFFKYIEKFGKNNYNKFGFSVGVQSNRKAPLDLGGGLSNIIKREYKLKDVIYNGKIDFRVVNLKGENMYVDLILKHYPKDKTKVKAYANKVNIKREIYEVIDEAKFGKCSQQLNKYNNRNYTDETEINGCENILKKHTSNIFKKGKLYKVKVIATFNERNKRNVVIEDYLPSSFRVINSKFKTESSDIKQSTTSNIRRDHVEFKPEVIFYNRDYLRGNTLNLSYFFRPEFIGEFTYPPVSTYMMYNPIIRANGKFRKIEVK